VGLKAMRSGLAIVPRAAALLLPLLLWGCTHGIPEADIDRLQSEMSAAYKHRGMRITSFRLTPDNATQVSGMIYLESPMPNGAGTRELYTTCVAKYDAPSHRFEWRCEAIQ